MHLKALGWTILPFLVGTGLTYYLLQKGYGIDSGDPGEKWLTLGVSALASALFFFLTIYWQIIRREISRRLAQDKRAIKREAVFRLHDFCLALLKKYTLDEIAKPSFAERRVVEAGSEGEPDELSSLLNKHRLKKMPTVGELANLSIELRELIDDPDLAEKRYGSRTFLLFGILPWPWKDPLYPYIPYWRNVSERKGYKETENEEEVEKKEASAKTQALETLYAVANCLIRAVFSEMQGLLNEYIGADVFEDEEKREGREKNFRAKKVLSLEMIQEMARLINSEKPQNTLRDKYKGEIEKSVRTRDQIITRFEANIRSRQETRNNAQKEKKGSTKTR